MCTVLLGHAVFFGARLVQCAHVRSWRGNDAFYWFQVSISWVHLVGAETWLAAPPCMLARRGFRRRLRLARLLGGDLASYLP
jgi:hypothetical protein